jgi:hypothetical protein
MRCLLVTLVASVCLGAADTQPKLPLTDTRYSVHTLVREDIFAGFLEGDMDRFARGEQSIDFLLEKRSAAEKPSLLAWKGGALLFRGVLALEAKQPKEFEDRYAKALQHMSEARKLGPNDFAVAATTAGIYSLFADRLPEDKRAPAWATAYECYQALWKAQERAIDRLPLHLKGELLGGLALSSQRTGHDKELAGYLDKILAVTPDSAYGQAAKKWKEDPKAARNTPISCLSCHAQGRLAARRAELDKK